MSLSEVYATLGLSRTSDKGTKHDYVRFYDLLFRNLAIASLLEIGIYRGASLVLWHEYFKEAAISGIDIADCTALRAGLGKYPRIQMYDKCSSTDSAQVEAALAGLKFDMIIDDGSHRGSDQVATFNNMFKRLNPGGIYIVEDVTAANTALVKGLHPNNQVIDLRLNKNRMDDILVINRSA